MMVSASMGVSVLAAAVRGPPWSLARRTVGAVPPGQTRTPPPTGFALS